MIILFWVLIALAILIISIIIAFYSMRAVAKRDAALFKEEEDLPPQPQHTPILALEKTVKDTQSSDNEQTKVAVEQTGIEPKNKSEEGEVTAAGNARDDTLDAVSHIDASEGPRTIDEARKQLKKAFEKMNSESDSNQNKSIVNTQKEIEFEAPKSQAFTVATKRLAVKNKLGEYKGSITIQR